MQASSINPLDARTKLGQAFRVAMLFSYLVNDTAAIQSFNAVSLDFSSPQKAAESSFRILFAFANFLKTGETIAGLSRGASGRNEVSPFALVVQNVSNWATAASGLPWAASDMMKSAQDILARSTGQAGVDISKGLLDLAFTYGMYRVSQGGLDQILGNAMSHPRNQSLGTHTRGRRACSTRNSRNALAAGKKRKRCRTIERFR